MQVDPTRDDATRRVRYSNIINIFDRPGKFYSTGATTYSCITPGVCYLVGGIAQGTGNSQRIGKRIRLLEMEARGWIFMDGKSTDFVTIAILYDRKPTGNIPLGTEIFDSNNPATGYNDDNSRRFEVLYEHQSVHTGTAVNTPIAPTSTSTMLASFNLDLEGRPAVYKDASTGVLSNISYGALYIVVRGTGNSASNCAKLGIWIRIRYDDDGNM